MKDQLSFPNFKNNSDLDIKNIPNECKDFNRMIFHTKNFFSIVGYGCYNLGYLLLMPKKNIASFRHMHPEVYEEFYWINDFIKKIISHIFNSKNIAVFEHGMCGCFGGLEHAHLHYMPFFSTHENLIKNINKALKRRRIGYNYIIFDGKKMTSREDIDQILSKKFINPNDYKVVGNQKSLEEIKVDFDLSQFPKNLDSLGNIEKPYIYFNSGLEKSSFITFENIETQLGREIIFNSQSYYYDNEKKINIKKKNNNEIYIWKWQENKFKYNIIKTIKLFANYLSENKKSIKYRFDLQTFS